MFKAIAATAAIAAAATVTLTGAADASTVNRHAYDQVSVGESRADVQAGFATTGILLSKGVYGGAAHRTKLYAPAGVQGGGGLQDPGTFAVIDYARPLGSRVFVVVGKRWCTTAVGGMSCAS